MMSVRRLMKLHWQHKCTSSWQLSRCQCSASVSWHAPSAPAATDLCFSARARLASARAPLNGDFARLPAQCLEDACCLVTLVFGVLAVVSTGRLTLESGVLAVVARGRLAPLFAVTDFNFPRCATFAPPAIVAQCHIRGGPRLWHNVTFAGGGRPPNFLAWCLRQRPNGALAEWLRRQQVHKQRREHGASSARGAIGKNI